jgi:glycerol-3-phosphate O-acyltransferase
MKQTSLSYAVGEWARVWPIQPLIKSLGAYFVRRGSGNPLYRRVLERYVQMAIDGGVVQAVFPEGGLSRDGNLRKPKIGLLDYMVRHFDPDGERDIVFVPVGLNYDRVLEDKNLLSENNPKAVKRSGRAVVMTTLGFIFKNFWLMLRKKWYRYGYAAANFGEPISLKEYLKAEDWKPKELSRADRFERVQELAEDLLEDIANVIPVLPVSLVATIFLQEPDTEFSMDELQDKVEDLGLKLVRDKAHVYVPRNDPEYGIEVGLRMLILRDLVLELGEEHGHTEKTYKLNPAERSVVEYYANSIRYMVENVQRPPNELIA